MAIHPGFVRSGLLPGNDGEEFVDPEEAAGKKIDEEEVDNEKFIERGVHVD